MEQVQYNTVRLTQLEKLIEDTKEMIPKLHPNNWIQDYYKTKLWEYELEYRERRELEGRR